MSYTICQFGKLKFVKSTSELEYFRVIAVASADIRIPGCFEISCNNASLHRFLGEQQTLCMKFFHKKSRTLQHTVYLVRFTSYTVLIIYFIYLFIYSTNNVQFERINVIQL